MMSQEEVAALMGHASLLTATMHYGRRSAGRTTVMPDIPVAIPIPSPENLAAVQAISGARIEALRLVDTDVNTAKDNASSASSYDP